ncbi:hypothetical protein ACM66B_000180 [Microbotryomycetes sp. NB124-2]
MAAVMPSSLDGLGRAISVIIVSEIGDKTFLIAAILSMRHPRMIIFAGGIAALALMSLLSSLLGTIVPTLLPKRWTTAAAALLFFVFGARMLQEGLEMEAGEKGREKMEEEMREVQKEVEEAEEEIGVKSSSNNNHINGGVGDGSVLPYSVSDLEEGRRPEKQAVLDGDADASISTGRKRRKSLSEGKDAALTGLKEGIKNLAHLFFSPIFIQAFVLTFLAEWGDRSQITTIALAAAHNVWLVTFGTTLGHSLCTAMAVISGRWISQHISVKHVTLGGAVLFLLFGVVYTYETIYYVDENAQLSLPIEIRVQAILSDMDGTLVDSTPAVEGALSKWARKQGVEPEAFFAVSHGVSIRRFQTVPKLGSEMTEDELTEAAREVEYSIADEGRLLKEQGGRGIEKLPGVDKLVNALKQGGARWGIVTSATNIYASSALTTSSIGMSPPEGPPFVITADNVVKGKPDPEPYLVGIEALNKLEGPAIDPSKVLVLEDAPSGLASGLAAGCQTLAVCTGQPRDKIRQTDATYKTVDFDRVEVVSCSKEEIVLRIKTLEEEEQGTSELLN